MKIPALGFTATLHLLRRLLFRLAVIANVGSFLIFFLPFYRIYGNYLDRGTYWFNAVGIAISNQSPTALLNTVDWDTTIEGVIQGFSLLSTIVIWSITTFNLWFTKRFLFIPLFIGSFFIFSQPIGIFLFLLSIIFSFRIKSRTLFISLFLIPILMIGVCPLLWLADQHNIQVKCLLLMVAVAMAFQTGLKGMLGKPIKVTDLGVCVFLGLINVSIAFAMGGSEIHINRGSYCLRYEYGFQLWWWTMVTAWLSILLAYSLNRFSKIRRYNSRGIYHK